MNIDKLVDTYMAHLGYRRIAGHGADPILPFFMLDVMLSIFNKEIKPVECKHKLKQIKKQWKAIYDRFNGEFFSLFNYDETSDIIDLMDSFDEYINNDVVMTKVSIMSVLPQSMSFEDRNILASASLCNIMAQSAQIIWKNIYRDAKGNERENFEIAGIERMSSKWMAMYFDKRSGDLINLNSSSKICQCVDQLCHKMVEWLNTQKSPSEPQN